MKAGGSQYQVHGKTHYERNKAAYIERSKRRVEENRDYVRALKVAGSCSRCGVKDFRVLEFDHRPGTEKRREISIMVVNGFSLVNLKAEIEKCDMVCANCHRILTWERRQE